MNGSSKRNIMLSLSALNLSGISSLERPESDGRNQNKSSWSDVCVAFQLPIHRVRGDSSAADPMSIHLQPSHTDQPRITRVGTTLSTIPLEFTPYLAPGSVLKKTTTTFELCSVYGMPWFLLSPLGLWLEHMRISPSMLIST